MKRRSRITFEVQPDGQGGLDEDFGKPPKAGRTGNRPSTPSVLSHEVWLHGRRRHRCRHGNVLREDGTGIANLYAAGER
jgi:hypothetical protein